MDMADYGDVQGIDRRQFLKRAGLATAWAVPTMQVVNMAAARAQDVRDSVTDGTPPNDEPDVAPNDKIARRDKAGSGA